MIKDYHEIVTEAGRDTYTRRKGRDKDPEDLPDKEPMRPRGGYRFELLDNLNPLYRFLKSRIGKSWDKTYSDLSKLNFNSVSGEHIKSHIKGWVELNAILRDKKPYHPVEGKYFRPQHVTEREFWVDKHGILRQGWKAKPKQYAVDPYTIKCYKDPFYERYSKILHHNKLVMYTPNGPDYYVTDTGLVLTYKTTEVDKPKIEKDFGSNWPFKNTKCIYRLEYSHNPWIKGTYGEMEALKKASGKEVAYHLGPFETVYDKSILKFIKEHKEKYE